MQQRLDADLIPPWSKATCPATRPARPRQFPPGYVVCSCPDWGGQSKHATKAFSPPGTEMSATPGFRSLVDRTRAPKASNAASRSPGVTSAPLEAVRPLASRGRALLPAVSCWSSPSSTSTTSLTLPVPKERWRRSTKRTYPSPNTLVLPAALAAAAGVLAAAAGPRSGTARLCGECKRRACWAARAARRDCCRRRTFSAAAHSASRADSSRSSSESRTSNEA